MPYVLMLEIWRVWSMHALQCSSTQSPRMSVPNMNRVPRAQSHGASSIKHLLCKLHPHLTCPPMTQSGSFHFGLRHMSSQYLIDSGELGATQNQNESFNNLVWLRCSKTDFSSVMTVQIAVNLAILSFNRGAVSYLSLAKRLGIQPGPHCATHFRKCDVIRIRRSEKKAICSGKEEEGLEPA